MEPKIYICWNQKYISFESTLFTIKNGSLIFSKYMVHLFHSLNYESTNISKDTSIFKQQLASHSVSKLVFCR